MYPGLVRCPSHHALSITVKVCVCDAVDTIDQKSNCQSVCLPAAAAAATAFKVLLSILAWQMGDPLGDSIPMGIDGQVGGWVRFKWLVKCVWFWPMPKCQGDTSWCECCEGEFKAGSCMFVLNQGNIPVDWNANGCFKTFTNQIHLVCISQCILTWFWSHKEFNLKFCYLTFCCQKASTSNEQQTWRNLLT